MKVTPGWCWSCWVIDGTPKNMNFYEKILFNLEITLLFDFGFKITGESNHHLYPTVMLEKSAYGNFLSIDSFGCVN